MNFLQEQHCRSVGGGIARSGGSHAVVDLRWARAPFLVPAPYSPPTPPPLS